MTTIAYRNGTMAGDGRALGFDSVSVGEKTKVFRFCDGTLIGVSSWSLGIPKAVRDWVEKGMDVSDIPVPRNDDNFEFEALIVRKNGEAVLLDGNWLPSDPVKGEYYAIGSGKQYALAALVLGKSAKESVEVAAKLDVWTGGTVTAITH